MPKSTALKTILLMVLLVGAASVSYAENPRPPATATQIPYAPLGTPPANTINTQPVALNPLAIDTRVASLTARVDGDRWHAGVTTLARFGAAEPGGWGTRRTFTAGNLAARDWISATLADLGWKTSLHAFNMVGGMSYNVIGERTGHTRPDDIYIVGAHMDSTSSQAYILAPGAEDNASGTAALLEIARVLQDQTPASTIRLVAFSGEEQGLIGSGAYVEYLAEVRHELDNVKGVYIMDMIGYTSDPDSLHVFLQSYNPDVYPWMGDIRDHLTAMAATYTTLRVFTSNQALGSDHLSFLSRQVPAVLLIEAEFHSYPYYHTTNDLPSYVVPAEGEEVIKLLVATLADRAGVICIFADLDCDSDVDVADLMELANHWRSIPGSGYEDRYDLNNDGKINVVDIQLAAQAFTG